MNFSKVFIIFLCLSVFFSCSDNKSSNNDLKCTDGEILHEGECLPDSDGDFIPDQFDNCPDTPNYSQIDTDGDGIGDLCDPVEDFDADDDGIDNDQDNCILVPNPEQDDTDEDGVGDACDNCPDVYNPGQEDSDDDGSGDACDEQQNNNNNNTNDMDNDGVEDSVDNCPETYNPDQDDSDNDGIGDACDEVEPGTGTVQDPFIIPVNQDGADYQDQQDTSQSSSDQIDSYPPDDLDQSGPEYIYSFTLPSKMVVQAWIGTPEPNGVDIDVHLLSSLQPVNLLERSDTMVEATLDAGTYYLSLDTYAGDTNAGDYTLYFTAVPWQAGTSADPVLLGTGSLSTPVSLPYVLVDHRNTSDSNSREIDTYPPDTIDESGPEYYYAFTVNEPVYFAAELLLPEASGTDIDLHLLSSLSPLTLIQRDNHKIVTSLQPGTYYLVADTYNGDANAGPYTLNLTLRAKSLAPGKMFNNYILDAINFIDANYALLGYDINSVLTHDIPYGSYGTIPQTGVTNKTMCVAAALEILLVAMQLYEDDTGDSSVWDFLPMRSFRYLGAYDIKAHIWVNYDDIDSAGSADALRHFGMGINVPFEELIPGSFVNVNRTNGSGHAVVFVSFIDSNGTEYETWNANVIGFKYYSAQGSSTPGVGGMSYRYAVFSDYGCPSMPGSRDCNIIYSESQHYLNTGVIFHPDYWLNAYYTQLGNQKSAAYSPQVSYFDAEYFNGITTDD
ncbi:MAG: thrombospondin type 3 repeat-containing protein [Myxococcota bacterium]